MLHLRHSSFSNPSAALPMSQLILQPCRCFTYIIGTSPTSQLILQPFCHFIYATVHSTTLPPLHLRHSSFSNPSVASPMPQLILAPFPCFYVTGFLLTSPREPPMAFSCFVATVMYFQNFKTANEVYCSLFPFIILVWYFVSPSELFWSQTCF